MEGVGVKKEMFMTGLRKGQLEKSFWDRRKRVIGLDSVGGSGIKMDLEGSRGVRHAGKTSGLESAQTQDELAVMLEEIKSKFVFHMRKSEFREAAEFASKLRLYLAEKLYDADFETLRSSGVVKEMLDCLSSEIVEDCPLLVQEVTW